MNRREIGKLGEEIAEKYLKKRGWRIIANNFSVRGGEIDIVGFRFGVLVCFEVKTRTNELYGKPSDAVDEAKTERIKKAFNALWNMYARSGRIPVFYPFGIKTMKFVYKKRIDVIEIYLSRGGSVEGIKHIKDWGKLL